jgi:hypothetical protein
MNALNLLRRLKMNNREMTRYAREIERKFTVDGISYEKALADLKERYSFILDATSYDLYWKAPNVDFIRLRENSRELTVKVTDKGTVVDRIEENVKIEKGALSDCTRLLTLLHGEPMMLVKKFAVLHSPMTTICLYQVAEDLKERVFLEVEASALDYVDHTVANLKRHLDLTAVPYSLYQIFSEGL